MKNAAERLLFLLRYYTALLLCFVVLRILFMYVNGDGQYGLADALAVAFHGLRLDVAVAGYMTAVPLLLTLVTVFVPVSIRLPLGIYTMFASMIISAAFVADMSLYPFWEFKLDASFLLYIDSPSNAFASVTAGYIAGRVVLFLLFDKAIDMLLRRTFPERFNHADGRVVQTAMLVVAGGLMFLGIRGGVSVSTNNIGTVYYSDRQFLNHSAVNPIFSFIYSMGKRDDYSDAYRFYDDAELEARFGGLYASHSDVADTLLVTSRPNILIILLEGMSSSVVERLGGKKGVTPNLDRLSGEGVFFSECYANSYRTDRGLVCALSGYASFPQISVMKSPVKSKSLPSIAKSLGEAGYRNTLLYGGDINFTNMNSYFYSTGYNRVLCDKDFSMGERSTAKWGVADEITFDRLETLIEEQDTVAPWMITFLTLSSHEPWEVDYNRIPDDKVANAFAYTDHCLGRFIDRFKASPHWDNTLVVCLPDHAVTGYPKGIMQTNRNRNRIPLLLLGGAVKQPREISVLMNQSDLPATLLAQLGLPAGEFKFSRNVLSNSYTYPFAYHSYNNGISLIDSTGFTVVGLDNNAPLCNEPADGGDRRAAVARSILQATYRDFSEK